MEWIRFDKQLPEEGKQVLITVENSKGKRAVKGIRYPIYFTNNLRDCIYTGVLNYEFDYVCIDNHKYVGGLDDIVPLNCGFYELFDAGDYTEVTVIPEKVIAWMDVYYPDPYED